MTPLFATQPIPNEQENMASPSERGKTLLIFTYQPIYSSTESILGMHNVAHAKSKYVQCGPGSILAGAISVGSRFVVGSRLAPKVFLKVLWFSSLY